MKYLWSNSRLECTHYEDGGNKFLLTTGNYLPIDIIPYPRK